MEKDLLAVAEGILDAKEFLTENTKSIEAVQAYAENGLGFMITGEEAQAVLYAVLSWTWGTEHGELNGTDDYYCTLVEPLEDFEPSWMPLVLVTRKNECAFLYSLNEFKDIFGRTENEYDFDVIETIFNRVGLLVGFDDFEKMLKEEELDK